MKNKILLVVVVVFMNACSSAPERKDINYKINDLYYNIYNKEGDVWTGEGYEKKPYAIDFLRNYQLVENNKYDSAVPMRSPEVIKRILVLTEKNGNDSYVEEHYEYLLIKKADWRE